MISIDPPSVDAVVTALAVALASGYVVPAVGTVIATTVHALLVPVVAVAPFPAVLLGLAGIAGVYSGLLHRRLGDHDRLEDLQERMTDLQERFAAAREADDDEELETLRAEQRALSREWLRAMTTQFRPMVYALLVSGPLFIWLRWLFAAPAAAVAPSALVLPLFGSVAWTAGIVGPVKVWLLWYLGGTVSASVLARRVATRVLDG